MDRTAGVDLRGAFCALNVKLVRRRAGEPRSHVLGCLAARGRDADGMEEKDDPSPLPHRRFYTFRRVDVSGLLLGGLVAAHLMAKGPGGLPEGNLRGPVRPGCGIWTLFFAPACPGATCDELEFCTSWGGACGVHPALAPGRPEHPGIGARRRRSNGIMRLQKMYLDKERKTEALSAWSCLRSPCIRHLASAEPTTRQTHDQVGPSLFTSQDGILPSVAWHWFKQPALESGRGRRCSTSRFITFGCMNSSSVCDGLRKGAASPAQCNILL